MNNVYELHGRDKAIEEAGAWLARLDRGLAGRERDELREWLDADPAHPELLIEAAGLWDKLDSLSRLADMFPAVTGHHTPLLRRFAASFAPVFAAMLIALGGVLAISLPETSQSPELANSWNERAYHTAIGEHSTVHLRDGSELTLNTNSLVDVIFTKDQRTLILKRGEVYVQVAHDKSRPLKVFVGNRFVRAVGTAFNVKITPDKQIELIVTKGKVLVGVVARETVAAPTQAGQHGARGEDSLPVSAGHEVMLGGDEKIKEIKPDEIEVKLSWRGGNLEFHGESLEDALAEIERYTPVEFVIQDEDLKKIRVVGLFKAGDVDGLLSTLRRNFDISYERVNDKKVILTDK